MPKASFKFRFIVIVGALWVSSLRLSLAYEDGFGNAKKLESKHFSIYYSAQLDIGSLSEALNIRASDEVLTGKPLTNNSPYKAEFTDMLDTLFRRICDILDMPLYNFHADIKICLDQSQLSQIYINLFEKSLYQQKSFYVYSLNTIYISADNFTPEILGHEIAHALIGHYFVVLPSVKIQEVLAGYVEYQLRK